MEVFEKTTKTCIDNASITFSIKNIDNGETKQINVNSNTNNVEKIEDFSNY
ncbi:MAG: hypothetical protein LBC61_04240 [Candidatus Peribacteria bacterium]|jgi:hypothetical protein|nr:hypothetical protein [Candidatus Peribacteria bacterium]